jgi:predicted nucleic acid-binding protein
VIVADTTVWVDFLRGREAPHVAELTSLIDQDAGIALTDVILAEVLQGLRTDQEARRLERQLRAFDILRLRDLEDFTRAAALYRAARSKGHTIRRTLDCLIASVCIRERVPILHNDADFDRLAVTTDLLVHEPGATVADG